MAKTAVNLWKDIPTGKNPPKEVNVVIEIPQRSRNKYEYREKEGYFNLDRVIYSPFHYPVDYGFIPQTVSRDHDALDVLVLTEEPTFPGCIVEARVIGMLKMEDETGKDDKILAAPVKDPRTTDYHNINEVNKHKRKEIEHFFSSYKGLEKDKWVKIKDWVGKEEAWEIVKDSIKRYKEEVKDV